MFNNINQDYLLLNSYYMTKKSISSSLNKINHTLIEIFEINIEEKKAISCNKIN